jgi:predicted transcriptional regulator YdeE
MPKPQVVRVPAFHVVGLAVRTSHGAEAHAQSARIGTLWEEFFSESWSRRLPGPGADGRLYGVYSAYANGPQGDFDVLAGVRLENTAAHVQVEVQAGDYLVFAAEGPMPQAVNDAWGAVGRHFAQHPQLRRRYGTDFERYEGPERVAVHVGLQR